MASSFEFRRQHSRVWWSSFHGDDLMASALGSPIPRSPAPGAVSTPGSAHGPSPAVAAHEQGSPEGNEDLEGQEGVRDASSSPSTSHKSQDSGFSDSDGSHRANASPEVVVSTPSPTHTRLQLCLSGACTSTPRDARPPAGPTSFGGHTTPRELRQRVSKDDSCVQIQLRPLPAIPGAGPAYRRQHSAEETPRSARGLLSRSVATPASLELDDDTDSATPLNQTFPLAGPRESGHRAPRSFIKNRTAARRQHHRYSLVYIRPADAGVPDDAERSRCSTASLASDSVSTPLHATVLRRPAPDGGETAPFVVEVTDAAPLVLDITGAGPGIPAHTSTPKAAAVPTPVLPAPTSTPNRRTVVTGRRPGRSVARPVNLLSNYDQELTTRSFEPDAVPVPVHDGAVAAWLGELRLGCEPECSVTLQSKALLGADVKGLRQLSGVQLASPHGLARLQRRAHLLSCEYTQLCGLVQRGSLEQVGELTEALVRHVLDFLEDHEKAVPTERAARLRAATDRLRADALRPDGPEPADMAASLASLRSALTATVDAILEKQVQVLVNVLEGPASPLSLRAGVSALCALGRQGSALSELVVRCGGVRALLQVVLDARTSHTRRAALRALAAICCTAKAVRSLEQAGGVEVVAELLAEAARPEDERAEAAAVLAQITAPWVPDNARVEGLAQHLDSVVHALTRLVRDASSGEVLLLSAAALAHLSYVETSAVWPLLTAGAAAAVLQAVRAQGARCSVFLQEQAATLLANMSAVPEARAELAAERAVVALLCFLQLRPSPLQRAADIAAAERVQHKAAIALSRLASDPEVARQVVSLEGVPRLVRLCRDEKERNHSDGVLVACLAALRKIAANCGSIVLSKRDRRELLDPRLLDSFMLFSSRQESYV